jgi:hypothetical protein
MFTCTFTDEMIVVMGWTTDFTPYVDEIPEKPRQIIILGFSEHGDAVDIACGKRCC